MISLTSILLRISFAYRRLSLLTNPAFRTKSLDFLVFHRLSVFQKSKLAFRFLFSLDDVSDSLIDLDKVLSLINRYKGAANPQPEVHSNKEDSKITVIVPVYNGHEFVAKLMKDLSAQTDSNFELLIVNDCSEEQEINTLLNSLFFENCVLRVLSTEVNSGFPAAVNLALTESDSDVIILNSDTRIGESFVSDMRRALKSKNRIASVTAMSNAGSSASIPIFGQDYNLMSTEKISEINKVARKFNSILNDVNIEIPVGVGFAMAMSREAINQVGIFDDLSFSPGYGEEVDWCLRAKSQGWQHILAPNIFVWHFHGASFGPARNILIKEHSVLIDKKFRSYKYQVMKYKTFDPLRYQRLALSILISSEVLGNSALRLSHQKGGGSAIWSVLPAAKYDLTVEISAGSVPGLENLEIDVWGQKFHAFGSFDKLIKLALLVEPKFIEIGALALFKDAEEINFIKQITELTKELSPGSKIYFVNHDYFALCQSYLLIDFKGKFCGIPSLESCKKCIPSNVFHEFTNKKLDIGLWRNQFKEMFDYVDEVVCLSHRSRDLFVKTFPDHASKAHVLQPLANIPTKFFSWGQDVSFFDKKLNLTIVGGINYFKGEQVIVNLAKICFEEKINLNISLIGSLSEGEYFNINHLGPYKREDLAAKLENSKTDLFFFPSIGEETYSFVADEIALKGYPLVIFPVGAPYERLRTMKNVKVIPLTYGLDLVKELYRVAP